MEAPHLHQKTRVELAEGYAYRTHFIDLATSPTPVAFHQLFEPSFWRFRLHQFNELDLIRIVGAKREFDQLLCVKAKAPGGLLLSEWPHPRPGSAEFAGLMASISAMTEITEAQMAAEVRAPIEPPAATATSKKAKAA